MFKTTFVTKLITMSLILLFLSTGLSLAQTPPIADVSINYIKAAPDDEGNVTVSAYVSVIAEDGQPISDLTVDNFTLFEDGVDVAVASADLAGDPVAVVLVIDTSGSMAEVGPNGQPAIEMARQAAVSFISDLAPEDKAAVFSFNDEIILQQDLTIDHNAAINAVNSLNYKDFGGTCLYDAAIEAVEKSAEVIQGRRAVIVLTDGVDETGDGPCSVHTLGDVVTEATKPSAKVPVFALGFGKANDQELLRMARLTGGRGLIASDVTELSDLFTTISRQLKNQYLVAYQTQAASGEHSVVVKVDTGSSSKTDERLVFVPVTQQLVEATPIPPTPTPLPPLSVAIAEANTDKPTEGEFEILIDISEPDRAVKAELFVDDVSRKALAQPPFDRFVLKMADMAPGQHMMRVEVTDDSGAVAVTKREITISMPPTPVPIPTPAPEEPAPAINPVYIVLAVAVCLIALAVAGIIALLVFRRRRKQSQPLIPVAPVPVVAPVSTEDPFVTRDEIVLPGSDPFETMDEMLVVNAGLIVIESESVQAKAFHISTVAVTIGRDAGTARHDINIPDKSVSRHHAKIVFDGQNFKIFDTGSSNGTFVNNVRVEAGGATVQDGVVIRLGDHTKLRFQSGQSGADDPFRTMDDAVDDPFKTKYD